MYILLLAEGENSLLDCEFPFTLSEQEHRILEFPNSMIVCGRSGTGKTSCAVFRLIGHYHARRIYNQTSRSSAIMSQPISATGSISDLPFKQIFITASPKFCHRVKNYCRQLMRSFELKSLSAEAAQSLLRQIMTDDTLNEAMNSDQWDEDSFSKFNDSFNTSSTRPSDLFSLENDSIRDLPDSFGDLTHADFPLFIHYKKFISMLRVYFNLEEDVTLSAFDASDRNADYDRFIQVYGSLPPNLKSGIDASLAFSEIMGIIKGSEAAANSETGFLSREEYVGVSERAYHSFKESRERLYSVFESYQEKKMNIVESRGMSSDPRRLDELDW
jgi:hypothetical protein